jgi:hypothetical protein
METGLRNEVYRLVLVNVVVIIFQDMFYLKIYQNNIFLS